MSCYRVRRFALSLRLVTVGVGLSAFVVRQARVLTSVARAKRARCAVYEFRRIAVLGASILVWAPGAFVAERV